MADDKKRPFLSRFMIAFVIIAIIMIPTVMDQLDMSKDDVKVVGRVSAGIAGVFTLYGIFTKMLKFFAFVIIAMIALVVLVSEGVIEVPHFLD